MRECFIYEPSLEAGTIIRAYRAENKIYQSITQEDDHHVSEAIGKYLPKVWKL